MAGNVYSTYEMAKEKAEERMKELETDIFICESRYLSGREFVLKTRDELKHNSYLYILMLPFRHRFMDKDNAKREASIYASRKGKPVYTDKKVVVEKGYEIIKYHYLTYREPCLT